MLVLHLKVVIENNFKRKIGITCLLRCLMEKCLCAVIKTLRIKNILNYIQNNLVQNNILTTTRIIVDIT